MARPGLNTSMQMRGEQQMLLLPRMLMSIEILQLPTTDLERYLLDAAESNEALVLEHPTPPDPEVGRRGTMADTEAHDEMLRNQPDRGRSLADVVEEQLATEEIEPELREWVRFLVGCLDGAGFLSVSDDRLMELARAQGLAGGECELGRAIAAMQTLEPRGLGARNAIEALLMQLDPGDPDYALLCALLEDFLEELARNKLPSVARSLGLDIGKLQELLGMLRNLDPRPVARLLEESVPTIVPDILVEWSGDGHAVCLASGVLPPVSIDGSVRALAKDRSQPRDVRAYLRGKLEGARWIVEAIEHRGQTLLAVAKAIFEHQRDFLTQGPGHLRPLFMNGMAEELGIHVSTVSRAVSGKYAQTPWGIFPLRTFFQAAAGAGADKARDEVRELVRGLIAAEDPDRPMSDGEVVAALAGRDVKVARRTVAKYRKELDIPSSYRRRRYGT